MKLRAIVGVLALVISMTQPSESVPMRTIKVQSLSSGDIIIDGQKITIADLQRILATAKGTDARVWYYREGAQAEPTPAQFTTFKALVDAGLPIMLSTKPDFSDYVGEDGKSHPRMP